MKFIRVLSLEEYETRKLSDKVMTYSEFKALEQDIAKKYKKLSSYLAKKQTKRKRLNELDELFTFLKELDGKKTLKLLSIMDGRLFLLRERILELPIDNTTINEMNKIYKEMFYYHHRDMDSTISFPINILNHFNDFIKTNITGTQVNLNIGYITGFYSSFTYPLLENHTRLISFLKSREKFRIKSFNEFVEVCYASRMTDTTTIGVIMKASNFYPELAEYGRDIKELLSRGCMLQPYPSFECVNGIARMFIENEHTGRNNIPKVIEGIISYKPSYENIELLRQKYNLRG